MSHCSKTGPKVHTIKQKQGTLEFSKISEILLCLSDHNKKGTKKNNKVKGPLFELRNMFGTRIKIIWEEQLADPSIHYITSGIAL